MFKKIILLCLISWNIFSIEIIKSNGNTDTYMVKDVIDISDNISPIQAREQLLQSMRVELLKYVNGIDISSTNILEKNSKGNSNFNIFSEEMVEGIILEEKIISEKKDFKDNRFLINMEVQMKIGKQKGDRDTTYNIGVKNVKSSYNEGDKLNFTIEVSKDSYIYIFIKDSNNMVSEFYPNVYQKDNFLKKNNILQFPDSKLFDISLQASSENTMENLIVLASSEKINLLGFENVEGIKTSTYKNLMEQIIKIDKKNLVKYSSIYRIQGGSK